MPGEKNYPENVKYSSCQRTGNVCCNPSTASPHWTPTCPGGDGVPQIEPRFWRASPGGLPQSHLPPASGSLQLWHLPIGLGCRGLKKGSALWSQPGQGQDVGDCRERKRSPVGTSFPSLVHPDAVKKPVYKPWRTLVVLFQDELRERKTPGTGSQEIWVLIQFYQ